MPGEHTEHAKRVVKTFAEKLSQSGREHVGMKHFAELELLIELAIATRVNEERELMAQRLDQLSKTLRDSEYSD